MNRTPSSNAHPNANRSLVPVTDPTLLTTEQLIRTISSLREILEARFNGTDKVIEQIKHEQGLMTSLIDSKISAMHALHEEKFRAVSMQFAERDTRTEQTSRDSKVAVDAALTAQKEAVAEQNRSNGLAIAKSEAATAKQIDRQSVLLQTSAAALNDKIDDVKERLTKIEGSDLGTAASKSQNNWLFGVIVSIALVIGSSLIAAVLAYALRK